MDKITKAVIPCGGMGTRFLPITKAVPKEILPIIDTPVLAHIVNEAIDSGITDIMIVLGNGKEAIKNYFTPNAALEDSLAKAGKEDFLQIVKNTYGRANIVFEYQKVALGSGDAVLKAQNFTGNQRFALAWGDDLMFSEKPVIGQLMDASDRLGTSILGVQSYMGDDIVKYGVAKVQPGVGRDYRCISIVEKPALADIPSRLASLGRYVLTPDIYSLIKGLKPSRGEIQFTDAINNQCNSTGVYAYEFIGRRYDMGDKFGATQAVVEYALRSQSFGQDFKKYLMDLVAKL